MVGSPACFKPRVKGETGRFAVSLDRSSLPGPTWPIDLFLRHLASTKPVPGGGSAAALAGCLGCALGGMVSRILLSRPRLRARSRPRLLGCLKTLERLSRRLELLIWEDSRAFEQLLKAHRTHRGIAIARRRAIQSPVTICEGSFLALKALDGLASLAGPSLCSDLKAGCALLEGAFEAACVTAKMNFQGPDRDLKVQAMRRQLSNLERRMRSR